MDKYRIVAIDKVTGERIEDLLSPYNRKSDANKDCSFLNKQNHAYNYKVERRV